MPGSPWDQYKATPAAGNSWDQYKAPAQAPAPTSGAIGGSSLPDNAVPSGLQGPITPAENNKSALFSGLRGMGNSLVDTARSIHDSNFPKSATPQNNAFYQGEPMPGIDTGSHGNQDLQAGKIFGNIAQAAIPVPAMEGMLPSAERAGAKLSSLGTQLTHQPVWMKESMPALTRAKTISDAGGGTMGAAGKLLDRSQNQLLDFPETRDFYSNISRQSAMDKMSQSPTMKRQLGTVRSALNNDLAESANTGLPATEMGYRGQPMNGGRVDYLNSMDEYKHAKQLQNFGKKAALIGGTAAGAGLVGGSIVNKVKGLLK